MTLLFIGCNTDFTEGFDPSDPFVGEWKMSKKTLLVSLVRQYLCPFVVGVLFLGQLSVCPYSLISSSVVRFNSAAFDTPQSEYFVEVADIDDGFDFKLIVVLEGSLSAGTEMSEQSLPSLLLFSAAGFPSLPFVRPPPIVSSC